MYTKIIRNTIRGGGGVKLNTNYIKRQDFFRKKNTHQIIKLTTLSSFLSTSAIMNSSIKSSTSYISLKMNKSSSFLKKMVKNNKPSIKLTSAQKEAALPFVAQPTKKSKVKSIKKQNDHVTKFLFLLVFKTILQKNNFKIIIHIRNTKDKI